MYKYTVILYSYTHDCWRAPRLITSVFQKWCLGVKLQRQRRRNHPAIRASDWIVLGLHWTRGVVCVVFALVFWVRYKRKVRKLFQTMDDSCDGAINLEEFSKLVPWIPWIPGIPWMPVLLLLKVKRVVGGLCFHYLPSPGATESTRYTWAFCQTTSVGNMLGPVFGCLQRILDWTYNMKSQWHANGWTLLRWHLQSWSFGWVSWSCLAQRDAVYRLDNWRWIADIHCGTFLLHSVHSLFRYRLTGRICTWADLRTIMCSASGLCFELFPSYLDDLIWPIWDLLLICQRGWNRQLVLLSWWWTFQKKSHVTLTKVGVPRPFEPLRVSGAVKPVLYQAIELE